MFCEGVLCKELATTGTESATRGSGSSFSVECGNQCGVLHGDYRFPTRPGVSRLILVLSMYDVYVVENICTIDKAKHEYFSEYYALQGVTGLNHLHLEPDWNSNNQCIM